MMMKKQNKKQWMGFIVMAFWVISGCAGGNTPSENETPVSLSLKMPEVQNVSLSSQRKPAGSEVGSVRVRVTVTKVSDALASEVQNVVAGEALNMVLNLEPGLERLFTVEAFEGQKGEGELLFRGRKTVDITEGEGINIVIDMLRAGFAISFNDEGGNGVVLGQRLLMTASGAGLPNGAFDWSLVPDAETDLPLGELEAEGRTATYTAPDVFPDSNTVTIRVTNSNNPSEFTSVLIILLGQNFVISPKNVVLEKSAQQLFSVVGPPPSEVDWIVNGVSGGSDVLGLIDETGTYTAPDVIPTDAPDETPQPFGNPLPIKIEATAFNVSDLAMVKVVTGGNLKFNNTWQITPPDTGSSETSNRSAGQRSIVFVDGKVTAAWTRLQPQSDGPARVSAVYSESVDGVTWTPPTGLLNLTSGAQAQVSMAASPDDTIYAAFLDCGPKGCANESRRVRLVKKAPTDSGFSEVSNVDIETGVRPQSPSVAISPNGTVFLAWSVDRTLNGQDIQNLDVVLQRFKADGSAMDVDAAVITQSFSNKEIEPALAVSDGGLVYLSWVYDKGDDSRIEVVVSENGGKDFSAPVQVNDSAMSSSDRRPSVVAGPENSMYIAWQKNTCGPGCYTVAFDKGTLGSEGLVFRDDYLLPPAVASATNYSQTSPTLAWNSSSGIYLVFQEKYDFGNTSASSGGIFLYRSVEDGLSFSTHSHVDDDGKEDWRKFDPSIALDSAGRVFASWTDLRGGTGTTPTPSPNYIWFAKGE